MARISDEIRDVADEYDVLPLYKLADRIDSELIELPKDRDGIPFHVGDTIYGRNSGCRLQVVGLRLEDAWVISANSGFGPTSAFIHIRPDSFERIAKELDEWCDDADVDGDACDKPRELADRIRRLAAKEGER